MEIFCCHHQQMPNDLKLKFCGGYTPRGILTMLIMWGDFVYQVKHKNSKKSNEMYYPRFTKVIIHHFMSNDPSIPRKNKVNWHYVRDDHMFSTIKLLTYISQASGSGADEGTGSIPGVPDVPTNDDDEGNGEDDIGLNVGREEGHIEEEEEEEDELYKDVNINQGRGIQATLEVEDLHVTLTPINPDGQQSSSVSSQFVTSMLNPTLDVVSAILEIVQRYMDQRMNEAVKVAV
nr:hypothetical protein [Tanacetum cinerariifolium]